MIILGRAFKLAQIRPIHVLMKAYSLHRREMENPVDNFTWSEMGKQNKPGKKVYRGPNKEITECWLISLGHTCELAHNP